MKLKSDSPIKPLKDNTKYSPWKVPSLELGDAPNFIQPVEEEEVEELSEEEQERISAEELQAIRDEAYQQGLNEGREAGLAAAKQQIDELTKSLSEVIEQLTEPTRQCGEQTQNELLQLAFAIARQIVRRELQQDPTQLIAIIREALKLLPVGSKSITIALHPEDALIVKNALSIGTENDSGNWEIKGDPSVVRGGCQVNTENSKVDASIDKQIAVLFSRIAGGQRAGESDGE
ncbi:flagellar assembly protein FliH [Aliikangiella coralliicola]|nr:flagellar assembly protein FliH [Aliikangiella coralliicola]